MFIDFVYFTSYMVWKKKEPIHSIFNIVIIRLKHAYSYRGFAGLFVFLFGRTQFVWKGKIEKLDMENSESTSLLHLLYIYLPHLAKNIKKKLHQYRMLLGRVSKSW